MFQFTEFFYNIPSIATIICFTVENNMLHGFYSVAAVAHSAFLEVFDFEPELPAFVGIVDEFPQEGSHICGDVSSVFDCSKPYPVICWACVVKVVSWYDLPSFLSISDST